ncbi:hypothetical protein AAZX31_10G234000 [Glycine max]|uniref:Uncharacterized protein n=2 Tax=Glycine subgen. Soja TaxID=1462606 RepID=K7LL87_SOYBN|nr:uncharacterized protein LOC100775967 [Glycine max]XP_028182648.1 uncharacterized protein LOC114369619 [Glycine soja]KAG4984291.1 hypothetical protein JHK87_029040 [Glycine soja]KAG4998348.1 hypothetical protein JHK85_029787 [Glycine max]KAG5005104.1 hypothetical protein JHK86_029243 [Glycine max]KAG5128299.1 hypothetical protein JHK82_029134 [Glycine max]KAG5152904.1 hypothetical protein JHK84_029376 [Glycine max]|eukprot:XP_003536526.1 uncharacterized protein LOC100775967 [Glycine max]
MANKNVALLLLVCLVVAAGVEARRPYAVVRDECFGYCWHGCIFPSSYCNWWCDKVCKYPIDFGDDGLNHVDSVGHGGGHRYPVPTEEDYEHRPAALSPESPVWRKPEQDMNIGGAI